MLQYHVKVAKLLLKTDIFLEPEAQVGKTEAERLMKLSLNLGKLIERIVWDAEKTVSVRFLSSNESPHTDISDHRTSSGAYAMTDSAEEQH